MANLFGTAQDSLTKVKKTSKKDKKAADQKTEDKVNLSEGDIDLTGAFGAEKLAGYTEGDASVKDTYRYGSEGVTNEPSRAISSFAQEDTEATIRIIKEDTKADILPPYTKFILESVQEAHSERQQIVETFGDYYVFMFGERPPMYNFGGSLINSRNINWVSDFMLLYERYFRGTRCAEQGARVLLTYGGRQIEGYIINTSNQTAASSQEAVNFSFQMIVTSRKILGVSSDFSASLAGYGARQELNQLIVDIGGPGIAGSSQLTASEANVGAKSAVGGFSNPLSMFA